MLHFSNPSIAAAGGAPSLPGDLIFQCKFDGTNGQTTIADESPLAATVTCAAGAQLSSAEHTLGLSTSLKSLGQVLGNYYATAPANAAYNALGDGGKDFTVEFWMFMPDWTTANVVQQWCGVWATGTNALNQHGWRVCTDSERCYFQSNQSGVNVQSSFIHAMLTNTWYHVAWCRRAGTMRGFRTGQLMYRGDLPDGFDHVTLSTPLYIIGSNNGTGSGGYMQELRITKAAWYTDDAGFTPWGIPFT